MNSRFAKTGVNATRNETQAASAGLKIRPETGVFKRRGVMFVRYPTIPRRAADTAYGS